MDREAKNVSKSRYIFAWVLATAANGVVGMMIGALVAVGFPPLRFPSQFYLGLYLISMLVAVPIWIGVYSQFSTLDCRRVVPWMWGIGVLGALISAGDIIQTYRYLDAEVPFLVLVLPFISVSVVVVAFTRFSEMKDRPQKPLKMHPEVVPQKRPIAMSEDFLKAVSFFPDLDGLNDSLIPYGEDAHIEFQRRILAEKKFKDANQVREEIAQSFLMQRFGSDPEILQFAKQLVESGQSHQAAALADFVRIFGGSVSASEIIDRVQREEAKFDNGAAHNDEHRNLIYALFIVTEDGTVPALNHRQYACHMRTGKGIGLVAGRYCTYDSMESYRDAADDFRSIYIETRNEEDYRRFLELAGAFFKN